MNTKTSITFSFASSTTDGEGTLPACWLLVLCYHENKGCEKQLLRITPRHDHVIENNDSI